LSTILALPLFIIFAFEINKSYRNAYKVLTAKCKVCGKGIKGQVGRKIGFIYTP